jgi:hypothetical protein
VGPKRASSSLVADGVAARIGDFGGLGSRNPHDTPVGLGVSCGFHRPAGETRSRRYPEPVGGRALRAALVTAVAVASLVAVPTAPALAVSTGRPTAIAVAPDGTSYVGFADADGLLVLAPNGSPAGSIALEGVGPVTGLAVDSGNDIWVDDGSAVTRLSRAGAVRDRWSHRPATTCAASTAHDPGRFGGIAVTASRVYVAGRCRAEVGVYTRGGTLRATVDLPGSGLPRGITWAPAYKKVPARIYVAVPETRRVYAYDAGSFGSRAKPVGSVRMAQPSGYATPWPGGVAADDRGHLAVLDAGNNALYLYDARAHYGLYRTLGHPSKPAAARGYLRRPAALAQGRSALGRNFWVADTGNGRVQRWNPAGTTQWMADTRPPSGSGTPVVLDVPTITGSTTVGGELTCSDGAWSGTPSTFTRTWLRDGAAIDGATGATYVVAAEDVGTELSCVVTATNAIGTGAPAASLPVAVGEQVDPTPVATCRGAASVSIVADGAIARDPYVTLRIVAPEGATQAEISNDGFKHYDTKPLVAGCAYPWTLEGGAARRPKVVSVRFPGVTGVVRDTIVLDGVAPVIHRVSAKWVTARQGWVLKVKATDRGTGLAKIRVGKTRKSARTYSWPADIVSWDSTQLRWIQVVDRVGNKSTWARLRL